MVAAGIALTAHTKALIRNDSKVKKVVHFIWVYNFFTQFIKLQD